MSGSREPPGSYSSPACFMHEVDEPQPEWPQIKGWRTAWRAELIAARQSREPEARKHLEEQVLERLRARVDVSNSPTLGIYFPIRGEIDVRALARQHIAAGGRVALPVVVTKGAPVEFWRWDPDSRTRRGLWNIPIPRERIVVNPDTLIVPLIGFDRARYRLGYGGGYYDRTLAAASPRPRTLGIAHSSAELPTIHPQPHDIPMDSIITEAFVLED
jgi:5-formyltetrahydrofolate cyclo-ligase